MVGVGDNLDEEAIEEACWEAEEGEDEEGMRFPFCFALIVSRRPGTRSGISILDR